MSDPIAEAAAQMSDAAPSSTEPVVPLAAAELPNDASTQPAGAATPASTGNVLVNAAQANYETITLANVAASNAAINANLAALAGNMLVNAAPVVDAPALDAPAVELEADELPRESHLMLLEAKIAAFRAKLANAERVALDEFEAIVGHIKAVLQ
jgi:hypothetical protein